MKFENPNSFTKINRFIDNKIYDIKNKIDSNTLLKYESLPALSEEEIVDMVSAYTSPHIVDPSFTNRVNEKYGNINENIEKFVFDEKRTGIQNILQDKDYSQYSQDLHHALKEQFGKSVIVRRLQGYQGDGRGVSGLISTSYNTNWGNIHDDAMRAYLVKTEDIPIAGYATEAELLVPKTRVLDIKKMHQEGGFQSLINRGVISEEIVENLLRNAGLEILSDSNPI